MTELCFFRGIFFCCLSNLAGRGWTVIKLHTYYLVLFITYLRYCVQMYLQYICQNKLIFEWINNYSVKRPKSWIFGLWHMYGIIIHVYNNVLYETDYPPSTTKSFFMELKIESLHIYEKNFRDCRKIVCFIHYRGRDHKKLRVKEITSNEPCIIKLTS